MSAPAEAATRFPSLASAASQTNRNRTRIETGLGEPAVFQAPLALIWHWEYATARLRATCPFYDNGLPHPPVSHLSSAGAQTRQGSGTAGLRHHPFHIRTSVACTLCSASGQVQVRMPSVLLADSRIRDPCREGMTGHKRKCEWREHQCSEVAAASQ